MECFLCQENKEYLIKKYKYWSVMIHPNQCYLGRCIIKLNRHIIDLMDKTKDEQEELFVISKSLKKVLSELFSPDKFNYAFLGNNTPHLHMQFVPRYKEKRVFSGIKFLDNKWGEIYAPYDKEFKIDNSVIEKLIEEIRKQL